MTYRYLIIGALGFLVPGALAVLKGYCGYRNATTRAEEIKYIRYSLAGAACCGVAAVLSVAHLFQKYLP